MRGLGTAKTREVVCTHCGGRNEVARRAMSVFCAHCRKRLILEDYNIKSYQAVAGYATCGDVIVHKQGRVAAPIQANNLTVKGTVQGNVRVRGHVEIEPNGVLTGKVTAPSITVSDGARLDAFMEIRPEPLGSEVRPAGVITESAAKPSGEAARAEATPSAAKVARTPAIRTRTRKAADPSAEDIEPAPFDLQPAAPPPPADETPKNEGPKPIKSISTRRRSTPRST